jgi:hypothetical protein
MDEKKAGLNAVTMPVIQNGVPSNVVSDLATLTSIANYLETVQTAGQNLNADAQAILEAVPAAPGDTASVVQPQVTDIQAAYTAIFTTPIGLPSTVASKIATVIADLAAYANSVAADAAASTAAANAAAATIADHQATISRLESIVAQPTAPLVATTTTTTTASVTPPNQMTTTTFLVGVASVLAIGGGVWWVARNAKTKAREAHESGAFKKKLPATTGAQR